MLMESLMRALKVCLLFTFLFILTLLHGMQPKIHFFDDDSKLIYEVNAQAAKKLKKLYSLEPMGTGFSCPDDHILSMDLSLTCYGDYDIPKARILILQAARTYLETINGSKKLKPFLVEHPFGPKNIYFTIDFAYPGKYDVEIGKLVWVSVINGHLIYGIKKTEYTHETIHKETFEEAERILQSEK